MEKPGKSEESPGAGDIKERLMKLGIKAEFDEDHYSKTHRDIKAVIESLLDMVESLATSTFNLTTTELEYIAFYLSRWSDEPKAAKILEKVVEEIRRRRASST